MFFASGASALIFEALWFHQASLAFGNSVWASSLVLSGFMAGMALGNLLCERYADNLRSALYAYGCLELVVAFSGIMLVALLPGVGKSLAPLAGALASLPLLLNGLRFVVSFLLLLVPSAAMGMTLPILLRAFGASERRFGSALGLLYGANTLGAVAGVMATELTLLVALGVRGSSFVAGGLNVFAVIVALRLLQSDEGGAKDAVPAVRLPWTGFRVLAGAFLSGFALLALEVVWLRVLMLFLNDSPLAFAIVLAVVLTGIAVGGLLASAWLSRIEHADRYLPMVAYSAGMLGVGGFLLYPGYLQRYLMADQTALSILAVATPLVLPTSLASGALFALLGAALRRVTPSNAAATARLAFFNTLGAGVGSLLAGFVLLPRFGMEWSLFGLLALYGVIGLLTAAQRELTASLRGVSLVTFVAVLALFPFGDVRSVYVDGSARRWMREGDSVVAVREGLSSTIVHIRHTQNGLPLFDQLATNAYSMTVNDFAARRYMDLFVYLPVAIHPHVRRALLVGYGLGNTAEALVRTKEIEHIDVVDTSREMLEMSRKVEPKRRLQPIDDPRVQVHIEDGRYFLESTTQHFDLITGEPPPPIMAGVSSLYSREYFQLLHRRLADGGIATYWLPMMNITAGTGKSIIAAFCGAFEDCSLWHGSARNVMLMGTRKARGPVTEQRFRKQFSDPAQHDEFTAVGFDDAAQLGALFIGDAAYLKQLTRSSPPLIDDRPKRMHQPGTHEQRDALIWLWRDTKGAAQRFVTSGFIAGLWPQAMFRSTLREFENQRVLNDLLFPEQTPVRQLEVLHQVLHATRLQLPVLLLLGSDSDVQRAIAHLPTAKREAPEWLLHRAAGYLAVRDYNAALPLLLRVPEDQVPYPDLVAYVQYVVQREAGAVPDQPGPMR
jgi:predicted membrane-bound spermidine synthase